MELNGVLDWHFRMCILSGIYVLAKIVEVVEVTSVWIWHFQEKFGLMRCSQLLNDLQDCNETQWSVSLPYWKVLFVRNLCLGSIVEMTAGRRWRFFFNNMWSHVLSVTPPQQLAGLLWILMGCKITILGCAYFQEFMFKVHFQSNSAIVLSTTKIVLIVVWSWIF